MLLCLGVAVAAACSLRRCWRPCVSGRTRVAGAEFTKHGFRRAPANEPATMADSAVGLGSDLEPVNDVDGGRRVQSVCDEDVDAVD